MEGVAGETSTQLDGDWLGLLFGAVVGELDGESVGSPVEDTLDAKRRKTTHFKVLIIMECEYIRVLILIVV